MVETKPKTTAKAPAKRSGVKSESTGEATQIRDLKDRVSKLEAAVVALSQNNLAVAQDVMDSHL